MYLYYTDDATFTLLVSMVRAVLLLPVFALIYEICTILRKYKNGIKLASPKDPVPSRLITLKPCSKYKWLL